MITRPDLLPAKDRPATRDSDLEPLPAPKVVSAGIDYYKPNMSQLAYEREPDAEVTFTFRNRGEQRLLDYIDVDVLRQRFDELQAKSWTTEELDYLSGLQQSDGQAVYGQEYLTYLQSNSLPDLEVTYDETSDDIAIETTGPWALSTFWETVVMSEVNEAYFEGYLQSEGLDPIEVYEEGDRRLSEKIAVLQQNPDIKFAEFGTRRHFSYRWQQHVLGRILEECPENVIGTSNVALAEHYGIQPIGTFAHELPMVYAALAQARGQDVRASHNTLLRDWYKRYGEDYSIALTDTFRTDFFFADFTADQANTWDGVRHDSGDPYEFGERLIEFYESKGVDPCTKSVVFSDGLDIDTIVALHNHFKGRIKASFGWGTTLTNDLGIKPLNVVMKATHVRLPETGQEAYTVKLSDAIGKHMGPEELVREYEEQHFAVA